ncbi:helix-turn-helix transcriptional regulator [Vitiosangium sp. GDMCC 1.1324]|uniref:ArsR/SmtB family transcription factor n=1 Tax=Vitiosangium sp. (strain GDMCC 1.1324) TaxID=2138576 RepID=UPI000D3CA835|nr:winged helix-turn-helix domain-containing protein [Vitiosangium sp. GDMCC 1.1324]PTL76889.1 transcriptional regulator [Vitiosangium sp. GDMCC 1.1324]
MSIDPNPAFPAARHEVARIGGLLGDSSRAAILLALLDGDPRSAGDLARAARVTPQTASAHLAKLVEGGLLVVKQEGRDRLFRLASGRVADTLVAVASLSPMPAVTRQRLALEPVRQAFRRARICHHHLAGKVGVAVTEALLQRGLLRRRQRGFSLTSAGRTWMEALGVAVHEARENPGDFAAACPDWTEECSHLGGRVGEALTSRLLELGWLEKVPRGRTLRLTPQGERGLARELGIAL